MKILVVGSSNVDLTARVDHLPRPGETITNATFEQSLGGKGANQAVAAARLGGEVTFITSLGQDSYAGALMKQFRDSGIAIDYVLEDKSSPTGTAFIFVAKSGENCIAVAPGANASLTTEKINGVSDALESSDIVVLQAEIPYRTVKEIALEASRMHKKVLYNPAPACEVDPELMKAVSILVVNEVEAAAVSGMEYTGDNLDEIATALTERGAGAVVITLGKDGVYMKNGTTSIRLPSYDVDVVDTVGAGDTFCGALAVQCADKDIDREALEFASAAASLAVTKKGAQSAIPTLEEVLRFYKPL
ncbi:MAG: ribokinase [Candidatus Cryptobacteroides sp.]